MFTLLIRMVHNILMYVHMYSNTYYDVGDTVYVTVF